MNVKVHDTRKAISISFHHYNEPPFCFMVTSATCRRLALEAGEDGARDENRVDRQHRKIAHALDVPVYKLLIPDQPNSLP
jgi:hypothetical protein